MEDRERESAARVKRGAKPLKFPTQWSSRPRLNLAEESLFLEFLRFAQFCGDDPRPQDALAWFEMRQVSRSEWHWLSAVFASMSAANREKLTDG